ncbi:MAG TPA: DUF1461 domain-containing protein [Candidatus Limnocylindrales bacterium]|jgi:integral membrane protein (TIGR01906 family)|nr:DUF1461 domain-containing protein [Candidatus Limnocylindrales bacterium]
MSTLSASARSRAGVAHEERGIAAPVRSVLAGAATAVVILSLALLPLLTPSWIHPAMTSVGATGAGVTQAESLRLSDMTVNELLFGSGAFDIRYDGGRPLYSPDEVAHMQDVRLVLFTFLGLATLALAGLAAALVRGGRSASLWRDIGRGAATLVVALVVLGVFAALAFGPAFELFHRLLFPGGNWAFDPAQSNLVRLYPLAFWQLSAAAYGLLAGGISVIAWLVARRRSRRLEAQA